jgi:nucleoside-diphosphate-sugar epimerase
MNVLIIGATGYLGTAIDLSLSARGHRTTGVARSEAAKEKLRQRGSMSVPGDVADPRTLIEPARSADAVVYSVQITDADPWTVDSRALREIRKGLAGTENAFIYVSGAWVYGDTGDRPATEDSPCSPPRLVERRLKLEQETLAMANLGIRPFVVRPGIVYGRGAGLPAMFVQSARERGAATIFGDGKNRWATIALADLGELVALTIERGHPGRAYNAVSDDRHTMKQIAEAASRGAGAGGATKLVSEQLLGQLGECLVLDQVVSAERAKKELDWTPAAPSIIDELERGY